MLWLSIVRGILYSEAIGGLVTFYYDKKLLGMTGLESVSVVVPGRSLNWK